MELLGLLVGAGIIAVSPMVSSLRPVAKACIKSGLALADMTKGAAAVAAYQWGTMISEAAEEAEAATAGEDGSVETGDDLGSDEAGEAQAAAKAAATAAAAASATVAASGDDLKKIKGIGPKVQTLLNEAGITTFAQLAEADPAAIKELLENGGPRYRVINPDDWAEQAQELMAA
ncbi:MAG: DUF4332 domain-containing protein [Caldilineaceae bacterium]|nr:DUF4332 domain-containing protein [Caldilineaceae bacterium]